MTIRIFLTCTVIFFFSSSAFSVNIRVLDFQKIIENNKNLALFYDQIKKDQETYKIEFKIGWFCLKPFRFVKNILNVRK